MTTEQWARIQTIFDSLVDLPLEERRKALERCAESACDLQVFEEVERLLAHSDKSIFIESPIPGISGLTHFGQPRISSGHTIANRFQVMNFLGRGGMGEVYEALDLELDEVVALKTLRPDLVSSEQVVNALSREVQLARRVTHVNVCRIFDLGRGSDPNGEPIVFLTMELIKGETLTAWLNRPEVTLGRKLDVLSQVVIGVRAAHAAGVLHCDLKPGNVLVTSQSTGGTRAVITDFGLARMARTLSDVGRTSLQQPLFGTPAYLAPEQIEGQAATPRTDIYSLGLVMYEAITGSLPFAREPGIAVLKRMARVPQPPKTFVPEISNSWNDAIVCCLSPDPASRFQTLDELVTAVSDGWHPRTRFRFSRRNWLAGVGAILAAGAVATWKMLGPDGTIWQAQAGARLLLTPIAYPSDDPQLAGVTSLLSSQLSQSARITAVDPNSVPDLLKMVLLKPGMQMEPSAARHVSLRLKIPLIVFGAVSRVGSEYVINIVLEQLSQSSIQPQRSWAYTGRSRTRAELMNAVHDCVVWVRLKLGETSEGIASSDSRPEEVTTPSWEALQKLTFAEQAKASNDRALAVAYLKQALFLDPDFALAHMRLGDIMFNLNRFQAGIGHWRRANELAATGRLTRREQLRIRGLYCSELEKFAEAESCFAEYSRTFPYDDLGPFYRAYTLRMQMRISESIDQLWEAERRSPGAYYTSADRANCFLIANDRSRLRSEIERLRKADHNDAAERYEGILAALQGDFSRAEQIFQRMLASKDTQFHDWAVTRLAFLWNDGNRYDDAIVLLRETIDDSRRNGDAQTTASRLTLLAWIAWRAGRSVWRQACAEAATLPLIPTDFVRLATLSARSRNTLQAVRLLERVRSEYFGEFAMAARKIRMEVMLAKGDVAAALREALQIDREDAPIRCREYVANALWVAGRKEEAKARYRGILDRPNMLWYEVDSIIPGVQAESRARLM
jgi:tetratricopeptide (TPR) repeat protein